jgi:invasion protein IalB
MLKNDRTLITRCAAAIAALTLLPAIAWSQGASVAGTFGNWSLYTSEASGSKICFVAAEPTEKKPANANRATALLYISAWPKDGIRTEVSVKLGYPIKTPSTVTVSVGDESYKLFPKDERAYVADATEELKLVEALKKGSTASVAATSARGTDTTDTYSLSGVTQALQALATNCP